ncbi:MAG: SLBB domain-containing protein [Defluviitaleaceae bacterium]|nr:SLBB domain-containing protein [Defluviitaleaceae bacterium]
MRESQLEKIRLAGVVGAGGAGFPTHVKLAANAEVIIANGAECEPLLRVDQQVMEHDAAAVVAGMRAAVELTGAAKGIICLKAKYKQAVAALTKALEGETADISLKLIDNYYPAGDEQALVYEATGRVVPTGGIPIAAGAVVLNVSTLVNIAAALEGKPVTHKYVTITGEVGKPVTVSAPIGMPVQALIDYAVGPRRENGFAVILGGPAMGPVADDWDISVSKTLGGVIVLPDSHSLILKKTTPLAHQMKLARSVCCQCNQCTELCPRRTLGLDTSPHKVMRALAYGNGSGVEPEAVISCCECGVCSYFACSMGLSPSRVMAKLKGELLAKKVPYEKRQSRGVSDVRGFKNLPAVRLTMRLGLRKYDLPAPMEREPLLTDKVKIPLKQHIGAPGRPVVTPGQKVSMGDVIADIPDGSLGAIIHASISGEIASVNESYIEIRGGEA